MVLLRPVTQSVISTATFGHPVFDWITYWSPGAWTNATLVNGWTSFGVGYAPVSYRSRGDMVDVRGTVTGAGGTGSIVFTLPVGFRPAYAIQPVIRATGGGDNYLDIPTTGAVTARYTATGTVVFSFLFSFSTL